MEPISFDQHKKNRESQNQNLADPYLSEEEILSKLLDSGDPTITEEYLKYEQEQIASVVNNPIPNNMDADKDSTIPLESEFPTFDSKSVEEYLNHIDSSPSITIGFIGGGRVGRYLARAFEKTNHTVKGIATRSPHNRELIVTEGSPLALTTPEVLIRECEIIFLTVSDDAIGLVVEDLYSKGLITGSNLLVHTSGTHGIEVFGSALDDGVPCAVMHPVMTFQEGTNNPDLLRGCPFTITASGAWQLFLTSLVIELGGQPIPLSEEQRPLYHAALCHASNYLVTLVGQSQQIIEIAGITDTQTLLKPLLQQTLENALSQGEYSLTGPISRGDYQTVYEHLVTLRKTSNQINNSENCLDDVLKTYSILGEVTARRTCASKRLDYEQGSKLIDLFKRF